MLVKSAPTSSASAKPETAGYFVANNLSIGGFIGIDHTSANGSKSTILGIGPRVGYNIAFSERFSFWPKVGFSYTSSSATVEDTTPAGTVSHTVSNSHATLNLFAPVMFYPVQHFFLGFGPALDTDLSGDAKVTTIAGRLTLGGWF